jgi:phosphatidylglycerophosphate synthase
VKPPRTQLKALVETIPNRITLVRIALIPILWTLFFLRMPLFIGIGLIVAYVTDKLDGFLARLLNQKSKLGDQLDSFADHLLFPSIVFWLVILRPAVYRNNRILGLVTLCAYMITIAIGLIRSGRFGGVHLLFAKLLGLVGYAFAVVTLLLGPSPILCFMTVVLVLLFSIETSVYHFRKDLFENRLHSLVLGILKKDVKAKFIRYLL